MIPTTLLDAFHLYRLHIVTDKPKHLAGLKTALKLYVLPGYSISYAFRAEAVSEDFEGCLSRVLIKELNDVENAFHEQTKIALSLGDITKGTVKDYRSHLLRFLKWTQEQNWYFDTTKPDSEKFTPRIRSTYSLKAMRKGRRCYNRNPYGLKVAEVTPKLEKQLDARPYELKQEHFNSEFLNQLSNKCPKALPHYGFRYFCTAPEVAKRQDRAMRESTFNIYQEVIFCFLGWLKNIRGWSLDDISLELVSNKELLEEFVAWGISERENGYQWASRAAECAVNISKWLYHKRSKKRDYRDIEEIEELKDYRSDIQKKRKVAPPRLNLEEKLVTFEECESVVQYLRQCCAPRRSKKSKYTGKLQKGEMRSQTAILRWWQRYLIIAILTYCPVRQREIRELELGRTLFREAEGYRVKLGPEDHKTGSKTGKGREYWLPQHLTLDLDEWLNEWRPKANVEHNFVFFSVGGNGKPDSIGKPLSGPVVSAMVATIMYKFTGKRPSPHIFRNIAITYQRKYGNAEQQEALAELMGHSVEVANKVYDQTTSIEKTEKAKDWWKKSN
ncbi:site-specific integrase [Trichocoleus desertorum AS-A10]|uniref:site-specific integrase n=1 Tax=Trichocoleus desertorum TaxID=1481672 RepID=UPI003296D8E3